MLDMETSPRHGLRFRGQIRLNTGAWTIRDCVCMGQNGGTRVSVQGLNGGRHEHVYVCVCVRLSGRGHRDSGRSIM